MKNRVTEILGSEYPIIQGAMRLISLGEMAAAVSRIGGFGIIAASGLEGHVLRAEIKKARALTEKPFGVNIPIYRPNALEALEIAVEEGVKTITTSAGDPGKVIRRVKDAGMKILHVVATVEMAKKAEAVGVDAVIAVGAEGEDTSGGMKSPPSSSFPRSEMRSESRWWLQEGLQTAAAGWRHSPSVPKASRWVRDSWPRKNAPSQRPIKI